ncbi:cellulose binding domain-containing protein [Plantactinospora siamensis]|uniref:Cellulose binding domain-containing protein n=1 Tax=Plantactinospora siamensis TaxID=555372 RepID=A0ABV6NSI8_9ACTN
MLVRRRHPALLASATVIATTVALATAGVLIADAANAAAGCRVDYSVGGQWQGGFTANVTVTNLGDPVSAWTLRWSYGAGQQVSSAWNATVTQSGSQVTATNLGYNGGVGTNGTVSFGFNGSWTASNPTPTNFTLNGVACTGIVPSTPPTSPTTPGNPTDYPPTPSPTPTGPPTAGPPTTGPTPGPQTLVGWAAQNGGTVGGGSTPATTVSTASALTTAVGATSSAVIRVSGAISCSGMLRVRSNKTIIGNPGATIVGCGFTISGDRNVIIRNLTFRDWSDDAINVQESATNIWIDHNTLSHGYDGAVDIKRGSDFVTVSWNHFFNHDKTMLLGHSDDNGAQDIGHLRVTYHHNWFDGTTQRHPRVRFGNPVHVYNNYYFNNSGYGVASTMSAGVLVEGNYFDHVNDPYHLGEADSGPGSLVARNNYFVSSGSGQAGGSVAGIPYLYPLDSASTVKAVVTAGAGAGRITL